MAKYKVLELTFMRDRLVEPGEMIDYDGVPGPNLEPVDKAAKEAVASVPNGAAARLVAMVRLHAATRGVNPDTDVNSSDFDEIIEQMPEKSRPSQGVIATAMGLCGIQPEAAALG